MIECGESLVLIRCKSRLRTKITSVRKLWDMNDNIIRAEALRIRNIQRQMIKRISTSFDNNTFDSYTQILEEWKKMVDSFKIHEY